MVTSNPDQRWSKLPIIIVPQTLNGISQVEGQSLLINLGVRTVSKSSAKYPYIRNIRTQVLALHSSRMVIAVGELLA